MAPLTVDAADRQLTWEPLWLLELGDMNAFQDDAFQMDAFQDGPATINFASYDYDGGATFYHGRLLDAPVITKHTRETFWGTEEISTVPLVLANADQGLDDYFLDDCRGISVVLKRVDRATGTTITEFTGSVQDVALEVGRVRLTAISTDLSVLETEIPKRIVTTTAFSTSSPDVGKTIPVVFGNVPKVPCLNVLDDTTNNLYDYVVCEDAVTISAVYRDGPNDTLFTITASEYTVFKTLYPGYTALRFTTRQTNFQGGLHRLYADVTGLSAERNFARAARTILANSNWGLGQRVNVASFATAEAALDAIGGLLCDGALLEPRQAQDVLRDLLMIRGMRLSLNSSGEWIISVDTQAVTATLSAHDGTADGERNIIAIGPRQRPRIEDQVATYILRYRWDLLAKTYLFKQSRAVNLGRGQDRTVEHPFIRDHTTADTVTDYLGKREQYGNETCPITLTQEARQLAEGDVVQVTSVPLGYSTTDLEVVEIKKGLDRIEATLRGWNSAIYTYTAGTLPTDNVAGTFSDFSRVAPSVVTSLSSTATGTETGSDGTVFATITIQFTTPTSNYDHAVVYWRKNGTTPWSGGVAVSGTGTLTYTITRLVPNQSYDITVEAVNMFALSSSGNPVLLATVAAQDTTAPDAASAIAVRQSGAKVVEVEITATFPSDYDHVEWYRHTADASGSATVIGVSKNKRFHDENVVYGTTYYYWAKVVDTTGNKSAFSPSSGHSITVEEITTTDIDPDWPTIRLESNTAQSIEHNVDTVQQWTTRIWGQAGMWSSGDHTILTPRPGVYVVLANVYWIGSTAPGAGAGYRYGAIDYLAGPGTPVAHDLRHLITSTHDCRLAIGGQWISTSTSEKFRLRLYQNSGTCRDSGASLAVPHMSATWVGPSTAT